MLFDRLVESILEERFIFDTNSTIPHSEWYEAGPGQIRCSFFYNNITGKVELESENTSTYYVTVDVIKDTNDVSPDIVKQYPDLINNGPYYKVDFESAEYGSSNAAKEGANIKSPQAIIQAVISIAMEKVKPVDKIWLEAQTTDQSRITLYRALANQFAKKFNKTVKTITKADRGIVYIAIYIIE